MDHFFSSDLVSDQHSPRSRPRMRQILRQSRGLVRSSNLSSRLAPSRFSAATGTRPGQAKRALSANVPAATPAAAEPSVPPPPLEEPPADAPEPVKPPKAEPLPARTITRASREPELADLPADLDILFLPSPRPQADSSDDATQIPSELPPAHILDEALNNLHISLHPQTQHRAAYASTLGHLVEPTLALYCPIEGGDYILDATVAELARSTGAEVLILDAVQLAAGEYGHFGKCE